MTEPKLPSAGVIAAAMLATPVMTRKHHLNARRAAKDADTGAAPPGALVIT